MKPPEYEERSQVNVLRGLGRFGATLARYGCVLLCATPALSGCLVTDRIDFEVERNVPPVIVDKPGTSYPIGSVIWIDMDSGRTMLSFDVTVRDENVKDDLEARLRIRTLSDRDLSPFTPSQVQQTGEVDRTLGVTILVSELKQNQCHRVELVVSGSFLDRDEPLFFDVADPAEDIAEASWLVWEGTGTTTPEQAQAIVESCEAVDDFLEGETQ